jgi:hypothetical protein
MAAFTAANFLYSVNVGTLLLVVVVGLFMGISMESAIRRMVTLTFVYWQFAAGIAFFVPLAILRGWQGSDTWVRLFGTGILWFVFVAAKFTGATLTRRFTAGSQPEE